MNNPIFIGGLDRSGKTYMRMMLSAHPRLFFSSRTNLWTSYYNRYGDLKRESNLQLCLADFAKSKHIRSLNLDFVRLKQELETGPVSYGRLFALIHEHHAEALGKARWGDQTEFLERQTDKIFFAYPNAKIIHMLRDPRDRYESMLHKPHRRGGLGVATARWHTSATLAHRNQSKYSGRYKVIRYETMVTDPKTTLQETCEFLGEDFFPDMLQMKGEARFTEQNQNSNGKLSGPLTTEFIGSYRDGLSTRNVAYIQKQTGKLMRMFGYPLEPIQFSWKESLRFHLIDETLNSLRGLGWKITKA